MRGGAIALVALACAASAHAENKVTLRLATVAPNGTAWAREMKAFARDVEEGTAGAVQVKWYFGGIAGEEADLPARIERGQIDGGAGSALLCEQMAPSMRVLRAMGVFRSWDESSFVRARLRARFDGEFQKSGFVNLGTSGLGRVLLMTRAPVADMAAFRKVRVWHLGVDAYAQEMLSSLGMNAVKLSTVTETDVAFEDGRIDTIFASPTVALAFQWLPQIKMVVDFPLNFLIGCLPVSERAWNRLSAEHHKVIQAAASKLVARLEAEGRQAEKQLLGGLMQRQGIQVVPPSDQLRNEYNQAAREARERWKLVPKDVLTETLGLLADFRSEHQPGL
jgi:TRAP-type C4-dicarboxylate transport system substrate-binding protein